MKTALLTLTLLLGFQSLSAKEKDFQKDDCDVCSTSTGSTSINFDLNNQNFLGLYMLYQNYKTYNGIFNNSKQFNEHYRTFQVTGNYMITPKWNASVFIPIHLHNRVLEDNSIKQEESGLGEISFQTTYRILQSDSTTTNSWSLNMGGGIKAPTAQFKNRDGQGSNPNFNLGSDAWDYHITTLFNIKFKQSSGLNTQFTYTLKSENDIRFQFGNQTDISILYYRSINWFEKQPFVLFSGLKSEFYETNKQYGYQIDYSKGYNHQIQFGGNLPLNNFNIGTMAYIPLKQNLMDERIDSKFKALLYLRWNF